MKKTAFVSLILLLIFSGCLLQPQVSIKSAVIKDKFIEVELQSNKQVNAEVQLADEQDTVLCSKNFSLNQGNNNVLLECVASGSAVTITVFAEGAVFSEEIELKFAGSNLEEKVLSLAETKTIEGETLAMFQRNFAKSGECNAELFVESMKKVFDYGKTIDPSSSSFEYDLDLDKESMAVLQAMIDETKSCNINLESKVKDKGNNKFTISYSIILSGDCLMSFSGATSVSSQKDVVVIEVDLSDDSVQVTQGGMTSSYYTEEMQKQQLKLYDLFGGCLKASLLGANPMTLVNTINTVAPPQSACSISAGHLDITYFQVQPDYLLINIKNNSDDSIELTGFAGSPTPVNCINCPNTLPSGSITMFNLEGEFSGNVSEEIMIYYTLNDFDFSQLATCNGRASIEIQIEEDLHKIGEQEAIEIIEEN